MYEELRTLATNLMRNERPDHTLRPTALVHEAYLRLLPEAGSSRWESRAHFFGVAARAMRQILVDHARQRGAVKRGGGLQRVTLDEALVPDAPADMEIVALHDALERLSALDERMGRVVELRTFAGLTMAEIAHVLSVSKRTVDADWSFARKWLSQQLA